MSFSFIMILLLSISPTAAFAEPSKFEQFIDKAQKQTPKNEPQTNTSKTSHQSDDFAEKTQNTINTKLMELAPKVYDIFMKFLVVSFLGGAISMIYGYMNKVPTWKTLGTRTMIGTIIFVVFLRVIPIFLASASVNQFTLLIENIILLLRSIALYTSVGGIIVAIILYFLYKLINHPDYFRWSRILIILSCVIPLIVTVGPYLISGH